DNAASVSQMLAQELNFSHLTVVSKLTHSAGTVVAEREVEGGTKEIFEIKLPAVIGANKGLNTPRYASLPGIMKAKKKTLKEYSMAALGVDESKQKTRFLKYKLPPEKPAVKIIPGDAKTTSKEVVRLLREEVKVV
ncbi:MAG: electron transfer flavoprotein beta subunit/FixA family protein, partial [Bdellovibrionales bacterium]